MSRFLDEGGARPTVLAIEGEAGIGKTTIVREALELARASQLRVFAARPAAGEVELPYVGLGDLLASADPVALDSLAAPQRAALAAALAREGSSAAADEYALSRGVLELLRQEAADGRLVLAIDDVQWLDRPTASALTFALRRLGAVPIRVLVAARTASGSSTELPFGLADWEDVRRVAVGPLSVTELGGLLRQRLGTNLSRPRLEALHRASAGNPLFALELARHPGEELQTAASSLPAALAERLRGLDAGSRPAMSFAAAALRPSIDLLLDAGVSRAGLRSALETGVLQAEGDRLSFAHPLLRAAAYEVLLPDERREIHTRLATASSDPVERGHHVSKSVVDRDEAAGQILDQAAEAAAALGDHAGAAEFLRRAAELSYDDDRRHQRQLYASMELELAGDVEAAATLARGLIETLGPGVVRAKARLVFAACADSGMSNNQGLAELSSALDDAGEDEAVLAELNLAVAEFSSSAGRLEDAVRHAIQAIELAERADTSSVAVAALSELGFAECMLGRGVSPAAREAFARADPDFVAPHTVYSPRLALAAELLYTTAFAEAEQLLAEELALAERRGIEPVEVIARGLLAEAQLRSGRWAEALPNARLSLEHARQAAVGQIITGASYTVAMTLALLGHHDEARSLAVEGVVEAEAYGDFWFTLYHRAVLGLIALAEDEPQEAVDALDPAWALMLERGLGELSIFPVAHVLGEALVAVGRLADAAAIAQTLRSCPGGERPWCRAMAGRIDALVASARGEHASARDLIAASLAAHADLPEPFERARSVHVRGRIDRSARAWGAARTSFTEALQQYDELGAARWAEKAAADIARLPGRRPADHTGLTAREREVTELAATGLANKEIAARLFISVSTVEVTLSKAYAKLGVRSRTALASRLAQPEANL